MYGCTTVCLTAHPLKERQVGGFQFLVILNTATLNLDVQTFCMNIKIFIALGKTIFLNYF